MSTSVGIVVIGRNEGQRLVRCLASLGDHAPVVYVDSGSTDGSVARATSLHAVIVNLDMSRPFTAARARNAGLARLIELAPEVEFVQFVDGDCEIHPCWLAVGTEALRSDSRMAVICGRLRERHPERTIFNRMCDIGWDYPIGEIDSCGGVALYRTEAIGAAGGFSETLIAGEEFELCLRIRDAGGRIVRIDSEMAWHDVDMTSVRQWWRRTVRSGYGAAEGCCLYRPQAGRSFRLRTLRAIFWGGFIPAALLVSVALGVLYPSMMFASLAVLVAWCLNWLRLGTRERMRGRDWPTSISLAFFAMFGKVAEFRGILEYWSRRLLGRKAAVIEYRDVAAPKP
ncbi:MAG: glycosyltransferase [Planctomycetota bacterium]|nr:glycosyltransferase [Planctomycetota bacterium]